ncbi:MAG: DUF1700 domain-containing protein [Clostridiales bacterium]|nr:DUF1700 domain-containing protein [Clostridiales bacterium]
MDKETFIDTLRRALYGKLDDLTLAEHMRYYENYILQEISSGRSEQDVLEELGDPRLIARTILETASARTSYTEYTVTDERADTSGPDIHVHQYSGWKGTAIMVGIFIAVLLILILVFQFVVAILPFVIVFGIIFWLVKKFWN